MTGRSPVGYAGDPRPSWPIPRFIGIAPTAGKAADANTPQLGIPPAGGRGYPSPDGRLGALGRGEGAHPQARPPLYRMRASSERRGRPCPTSLDGGRSLRCQPEGGMPGLPPCPHPGPHRLPSSRTSGADRARLVTHAPGLRLGVPAEPSAMGPHHPGPERDISGDNLTRLTPPLFLARPPDTPPNPAKFPE
jgi:hypothetical protein